MNLAFAGFLPPGSINAEERTFVELLSRLFERTVMFQGIGIKALGIRQLRSLPSRLTRKSLVASSSGTRTGLLPLLPIRTGPLSSLSVWLIRRRLRDLANDSFQEWVFWTRFPSPELVVALRGITFGRVVYEVVDNYAAEPLFSSREESSSTYAYYYPSGHKRR